MRERARYCRQGAIVSVRPIPTLRWRLAGPCRMMPLSAGSLPEIAQVIDENVQVDVEAAPTSTTLIVRLKAHDHGAWERFGQLYRPLVQRWCRGHGLQDADAED